VIHQRVDRLADDRAISSTVIPCPWILGRPTRLFVRADLAAKGWRLSGIRWKFRAVSHGRVVSTPTTISAWRSIRCLVGFWLLYTRDVEKVSGYGGRLVLRGVG
jgi:hypothetical protein